MERRKVSKNNKICYFGIPQITVNFSSIKARSCSSLVTGYRYANYVLKLILDNLHANPHHLNMPVNYRIYVSNLINFLKNEHQQ